MSYGNTILKQLVAIIPRDEYEKLAREHHSGQKFRKYTRWSQFIVMLMGQLSNRNRLRDITHNLGAMFQRLSPLGVRKTSRSTLARVNEEQNSDLYEVIFGKLLTRCQNVAPKHKFSFKINKRYLLDTTHIEMSLSVFPWAIFRQAKGGIKLHVGLDAAGNIPAFVDMSTGNVHESKWAHIQTFSKGSFICFDNGFNDYSWFNTLDKNKVFFVTRLKSNAVHELLAKRPGRKSPTITNDQLIRLEGVEQKLRLVVHTDPESEKNYHFITNAHHLKASEVADIYKHRWQIELFFKWIKQNFKVKTFLGTSVNAVMTQLWIAMIAYLLIAYVKFKSKHAVFLKKNSFIASAQPV